MDEGERPLIIAVGSGGRQGKALQVRVSTEAAPELVALMQAEGVYAGAVPQASIEPMTLAALSASFVSGLGGLATVLNVWLTRHRHRAVLVEKDGTKFEARGMSPGETEALVNQVLEKAARSQLETEHLYRGIPGTEPPEPQ